VNIRFNEAIVDEPEEEIEEEPEEYDDTCTHCSGTGEGRTEYQSCVYCRGSGRNPKQSSDDYWDYDD
jgi:DnaJ-class molecular chaperone